MAQTAMIDKPTASAGVSKQRGPMQKAAITGRQNHTAADEIS
jgi:hypothetical protein